MIKKTIRDKELGIELGSFREAKNLQDAILSEVKTQKVDVKTELDVNFIKDILASIISSPKVEDALWPLMARCIFGPSKEKVVESLFDAKPELREYYLEICYEVALENIKPFMKGLFAKYEHTLSAIIPSLKQ